MKKFIIILLTVHASLFTLHISAQSCLPEGIMFLTQEGIDNFQTNYPGCTEIEGDVVIEGEEISNLSGLNSLNSIGGELTINSNSSSTSLTGLENLSSVGGDIGIYSIDLLTSITGLDNIAPGSIRDLWILENPLLSSCEVQSICDYLVNPHGEVVIGNNAPGCNSQTEVEEACGFTGTSEFRVPGSGFLTTN